MKRRADDENGKLTNFPAFIVPLSNPAEDLKIRFPRFHSAPSSLKRRPKTVFERENSFPVERKKKKFHVCLPKLNHVIRSSDAFGGLHCHLNSFLSSPSFLLSRTPFNIFTQFTGSQRKSQKLLTQSLPFILFFPPFPGIRTLLSGIR